MQMDPHFTPHVRPPPPTQRSLLLNLNPSNPTPPNPHHHRSVDPAERGVRLVQLLLSCAAHTAASDVARADACLRLISTLSSPSGDFMQRLAARLAPSLASLLLRSRWPGLLSALHNPTTSPTQANSSSSSTSQLAFARALPYLPFAHAAAGRAVLLALASEPVVHLVDLGATHASVNLWAPVLRSLSSSPRGLKLTCVGPDKPALDAVRAALSKEADALGVPFQFTAVNSALRDLDPAALLVRSGEAAAFVSIFSLHELLADGPTKMEAFLAALRLMSPKAVVVAEQEGDQNAGPMAERFPRVLRHYGTMFDSVEAAAAGGRMTREERKLVEEMMGREMENVVEREGKETAERVETAERMTAAGFEMEREWNEEAMEEGRRAVESWTGDGRYSVDMQQGDDGGCPTICWHGRALYSVASWQCNSSD